MSYNPFPQPAQAVVLTGIGTSAVSFANPFPVSLGSSNITINGDINIPGIVTVTSTPDNPIHSHLVEVGTSGTITVPYLPVGISTLLNNVGIGTTGQVSININNSPVSTTNPFPVSVGNTVNVQGTVISIASSTTATLVKYIDETNTQLDSANRLRVAQAGQQYYYTSTVDKDGDLRYNESFVGTGCTSTFIQNLGGIRATSGISTNGYYRRGSRRRFKIRPGISHQWYGIINWMGRQTNCTKRRGMFTQFNGLFFEVTDDLYAVVRRRLLDGTLVEDRIKRSNFNKDILDGNGPSKFNFGRVGVATITGKINATVPVTVSTLGVGETHYNVTYSVSPAVVPFKPGDYVSVTGVTSTTYNSEAMVQSVGVGSTSITLTYFDNPGTFTSISNGLLYSDGFHRQHTFWFDFNGDRTCRVRFGVESPEGTSVLHISEYGDTLGTQFQNAPAIMDRTEIFNTGITSYAPAVINSGTSFNIEAEVELNPSFATAHNNTPLLFTKGSRQTFPIFGVGLRAGEPYQRGDMQIQAIQLIDLGNVNTQQTAVYFWQLLLNPTVGGTLPASGNIGKTSRHYEYTSANTVSGGIELMCGYFNNITNVDVRTSLNFLNMGSDLSYNNPDLIVLAVTELSTGSADGSIVALANIIENL